MNYAIYGLNFITGVHFGRESLGDSDYVLSADTIYSAICIESIKNGKFDIFKKFIENGDIYLSDAFPFIKDTFLIPKPMYYLKGNETKNSDMKKKAKKLKYISISQLEEYLSGNISNIINYQDKIGKKVINIKIKKNTDVDNENELYHIGSFHFEKDAGIYIIVGYRTEESIIIFEDILESLSYSGIGGKKNSGYGKFIVKKHQVPEILLKRIKDYEKYNVKMTLSISLPKNEEFENALIESSFLLEKRGGFIDSDNEKGFIKKNTLFMIRSGSCFKNCFDGDIFDVSPNGFMHPVYKYAKPMFMGVI